MREGRWRIPHKTPVLTAQVRCLSNKNTEGGDYPTIFTVSSPIFPVGAPIRLYGAGVQRTAARSIKAAAYRPVLIGWNRPLRARQLEGLAFQDVSGGRSAHPRPLERGRRTRSAPAPSHAAHGETLRPEL